MRTPFNEDIGSFSPDGRWVAYDSDESRRKEVYVVPSPAALSGAGGKRQISTTGGSYPRWRRDGREIFYIGPDNRLMVVEVNIAGDTT